MKEKPQLLDKYSGGAVSQWGNGFLFIQQGRKTCLNKRSLKTLLITASVLLSTIQFFSETASQQFVRIVSMEIKTKERTISIPVFLHKGHRNRTSVVAKHPRHPVRPLTGPEVVSRPRDLSLIPAGLTVQASLLTGATDRLVKATLEEPVFGNGEVLIENDSVLIGKATSSNDRLVIVFSQVAFPNGGVGNLTAHACDASDKIIGLKGSVLAQMAATVASSIGLGFVGGITDGLQDFQSVGNGAIRKTTLRNALLNATSQTAIEQSRNLMSDLKSQKQRIEVPAGTKFLVIFGESQ